MKNNRTKMNIPCTHWSRVAFSRNATSTTKCRTPLVLFPLLSCLF